MIFDAICAPWSVAELGFGSLSNVRITWRSEVEASGVMQNCFYAYRTKIEHEIAFMRTVEVSRALTTSRTTIKGRYLNISTILRHPLLRVILLRVCSVGGMGARDFRGGGLGIRFFAFSLLVFCSITSHQAYAYAVCWLDAEGMVLIWLMRF